MKTRTWLKFIPDMNNRVFFQLKIHKTLFTYNKNGTEAIDVLYNNDLIFSFSDPHNSTINLIDTGKVIYVIDPFQTFDPILGTDGDDTITVPDTGALVVPGKGNNIVILTGSDFNTVKYTIGDGFDIIQGDFYHEFHIYGPINRDLLTFAKNGTDFIDVLYDGVIILTDQSPYNCSVYILQDDEYIYLSDYM